ncbi:MAG: UvrD-helicase domain-containing protein [Cardiobacteriaceae bacterium]|nr:UvrD-helicase domain-containing protein [Cardiobacteriaceae bacterium]
MQSHLPSLNPQQLEAVSYLGGPLLVVAGAGSGKTGVITRKIAWLVREAGYAANSIYALTFTNKAAREMAERVRALLGKEGRGLHISTFHRLGLDLLQKEHIAAGLRRNFTVFDARDGATLVKELSKQEDESFVRLLQSQISAYKNANISAAAARSLAQDDTQVLAAHVYHHYDQRLRAYNAVDFDDLIGLPLALLKENDAVRERWQHRVRYLLVDEYQDTNDCQYALLQLLAGANAAFTAVGDDDQSIYAWRGARPENIAHLHEDYPTLKTVKLEQNYRCHQQILTAANALIAHNPHVVEKALWSTLEEGEGVHVIAARNEEAEAEQIVQDIYLRRIRDNRKFSDFAVLYRSNSQVRYFEQQLRELNLPYKISGGTSFFEHSEIRDLLSYLRLINNPDDDAAFLRIVNTPKREIGATTLTKLGEYAAQRHVPLAVAAGEVGFAQVVTGKPYQQLQFFVQWLQQLQRAAESDLPLEILERVIHDIEYEDYLYELHKAPAKVELRQKRIVQLKTWIMKLQEERFSTLEGLMQHLMLLDILDRQEQEQDAVQLMTLHSAKGLEFPVVYIAGCEEELLPHRNSMDNEDGLREERRLLYVGMTRAKETLLLSYAKARRRGAELQRSEPSRFFDELPQEGIQWHDGRTPPDPAVERQKNEDFFAGLQTILRQ